MTVALRTLAEIGPDPVTLDKVSRTIADHATLESRLTLGRLTELARALAVAGPAHPSTEQLPVAETTISNGAPVLEHATGATEVLHLLGAQHVSENAQPPDAHGESIEPPRHC